MLVMVDIIVMTVVTNILLFERLVSNSSGFFIDVKLFNNNYLVLFIMFVTPFNPHSVGYLGGVD